MAMENIDKAILAVCVAIIESEGEKYAAQIRGELYEALTSLLDSRRASKRE
jgi:hypothetical protein